MMFEMARKDREDVANGLYYQAWCLLMKHGKTRDEIVRDHGRNAGRFMDRLMASLVMGRNVKIGRLGTASYYAGVEFRPTFKSIT